jgi:hypothetical protein
LTVRALIDSAFAVAQAIGQEVEDFALTLRQR